jgi:hypothetical protein
VTGIFEIGSLKLFAQAGFKTQFSWSLPPELLVLQAWATCAWPSKEHFLDSSDRRLPGRFRLAHLVMCSSVNQSLWLEKWNKLIYMATFGPSGLGTEWGIRVP